jgi:HTH-type transcriptional regulator, transcriptional repressor of NAD biosynthesis genes
MKQHRCGLVVGKFSPLHKGHESVIARALQECERVLVLSYSKPEFAGCEAPRREQWLRLRFPEAMVLVVRDEDLHRWPEVAEAFPTVPPNDASAETHRLFSALLCAAVLTTAVDAVYGSEDYVPEFAAFLSTFYQSKGRSSHRVDAVMVDRERRTVPISGTQLRNHPECLHEWLSPEVNASFVSLVALLGGESTGKTTLCAALARQFGTTWAPEYGRELWESKQGQLSYPDLLAIAQEQVRREEQLRLTARRFLFCDTTPLTTLFYSLDLFGTAEAELHALASRGYDHVFLCTPDIPFQQDGTRRSSAFRDRQHEWYVRELSERRIAYTLLEGDLNSRVATVSQALHAR